MIRVALTCLVVLGTAGSSLAAETETLVLRGIVQAGEFFGPPGYGEDPKTDKIERGYYLQLPAALEGSSFVQLIPAATVDLAELVGEKVEVSGTVFEANTGHHRTKQVLSVREARPIGSWSE